MKETKNWIYKRLTRRKMKHWNRGCPQIRSPTTMLDADEIGSDAPDKERPNLNAENCWCHHPKCRDRAWTTALVTNDTALPLGATESCIDSHPVSLSHKDKMIRTRWWQQNKVGSLRRLIAGASLSQEGEGERNLEHALPLERWSMRPH